MKDNEHQPIITHEYDLDAVSSYYRMTELKCRDKNTTPKQLCLERVKLVGKSFCEKNNLNFDFYFDNKIPLIIPSTTVNFELYVV